MTNNMNDKKKSELEKLDFVNIQSKARKTGVTLGGKVVRDTDAALKAKQQPAADKPDPTKPPAAPKREADASKPSAPEPEVAKADADATKPPKHEITITLPDGARRQYEEGVTGLDVAKDISSSLGKAAIACGINGKFSDLSIPIYRDCDLEIYTMKDEEKALELVRHDAAHIMARAVRELWPHTKVTIGPVIENGWYYDFDRDEPFTPEDLEKIEKKMREIINKREPVTTEVWERERAIKYYKANREPYKVELVEAIPEGEDIRMYWHGHFQDLCRGPHLVHTGQVPADAFKLMSVAGAYWRGDSNNKMLQRSYGVGFLRQDEAGYVEVNTPQVVDRKLWEASGHWDKYQENMFIVEVDEEHASEKRINALKPMNCPCHVQIYNQGLKSYRDLPLRMAEFGSCNRYEPSGALHGIMRVRGFVQDDAHIFCTEDQIESEAEIFIDLLSRIYSDLGFDSFKVKFSDRPDVRAGTDETWDRAEYALKVATEEAGCEYELNPGEGAFYGPKLEFVLTDALGRDWQCGTFQVDFVLPERLDANYVGADGDKHRPVMLHRAVVGSFERFIGILIEEHAGKLPLWLAPRQVVVASIISDADEAVLDTVAALKAAGIRAEADTRNEKINYKVREHSLAKVPVILALGQREVEDGTVSMRRLGDKSSASFPLETVLQQLKKEATPPDLR